MSNWYRRRDHYDFYRQDNAGDWLDCIKHRVAFVNMTQWDAVKEISIEYQQCGDLSINILIGPVINRKIRQAILNWLNLQNKKLGIKFDEKEAAYNAVEYGIKLQTIEAITQMPQLLRFINLQCNEEIFSKDILLEIETITACSLDIRKSGKMTHETISHVIPKLPDLENCTNPGRIHSIELSKLLARNYWNAELSENDFGEFQSLLASGEDPNQLHSSTHTPLFYAQFFKDPEVYKFLLHYRGNPFSRLSNDNCSSLDLVLQCGNTVIANIIMETFSQPERPVTLMIKHIDVAYQQGKLMTYIDWHQANDARKETVASVVTEVKRAVTDREEQEIVAWSNAALEMPNDPQQLRLTESVRHDLHKENQVIEIIRSQGKMVGFNIFEIDIPEAGNKIYFTCNWSLIGPEFRQTNMMSMLVKRHALTLQQLNNGKVIVLGFLAADFNSYRLADDLHFPMYQADGMADEARWYHHVLCQRPDETYHQRGLANYVENQARVKKLAASPKQNFHSRFFHRYLLNQGDSFSTGYKAALVFSYVTDSCYLSLQKNCQRIGMNLDVHLRSLSYLLQEFFSGFSSRMTCHTPAVNANYLMNARYLFWLNREVESDKVIRYTGSKMRSKL